MKKTAFILIALLIANTSFAQDPKMPQLPPQPAKGEMSFFITSVGIGDGANLGGLAGADAYCQNLANASDQPGAAGRTWKAYLSTQASPETPAINARDRIGQGPWYNAEGVRIAVNLADLHGDTVELARKGNILNINTALDEFGNKVAGEISVAGMEGMRSQHDILTGTRADGNAFTDDFDRTCSNWTSNKEIGSANVGHHDRLTNFTSMSWNDAHGSLGCSQDNLITTGGAGRFYCFAID